MLWFAFTPVDVDVEDAAEAVDATEAEWARRADSSRVRRLTCGRWQNNLRDTKLKRKKI